MRRMIQGFTRLFGRLGPSPAFLEINLSSDWFFFLANDPLFVQRNTKPVPEIQGNIDFQVLVVIFLLTLHYLFQVMAHHGFHFSLRFFTSSQVTHCVVS